MKIIIAFLFVLAVFAMDPPLPTFPTQFATDLVIEHYDDHHRQHIVWEYDQKQNKERLRGREFEPEEYEWTLLRDYVGEKEYLVVETLDKIYCNITALSGSLPYPNFNGFTYSGQEDIDFVLCDRWYLNASEWIYYDDASTYAPVQIDYVGANKTNFFNLEEKAIDPAVFDVPTVCLNGGIECDVCVDAAETVFELGCGAASSAISALCGPFAAVCEAALDYGCSEVVSHYDAAKWACTEVGFC
ncbi:mammalian ependymin-related protein [Anaeramoeba ignava]|uniref:Mammalian ependymin-related protein n=1 Tax=Anaeramoeba ignava TaxID=1746090 RepID=A0A9Q0L7J4_ANAIG|nr:mammalian ependymin-related protein [Anaeramoeba ignava]